MGAEELKNTLLKIKDDSNINRFIVRERAEYNPKENTVGVYFKTVKHFPPSRFLRFKSQLEKYSGSDIQLSLSQMEYQRELTEDPAALERCVKDYCALRQPTITPFLATADVRMEGGALCVNFDSDMGASVFSTMCLEADLREYLRDTYALECVVKCGVDEGACAEYEFEDAPPREVVQPKAEGRAEPERAPVPTKQAAPKAPRRQEKPDSAQPVTPISSLAAGNEYTVEGEVISVEAMPLRDGELTKHKFSLCDYTGSLTCFFIESSKYKSKLEPPKKGKWVRVTGFFDMDNFAHENTMKAKDIGRAAHKERTDNAEQKRVELHVHTQMSAQDAVSNVKDIIARAAKWGHSAIAVTDHGVVQAFPEAERAAKQHGIKVIYGVEGYMVDDSKKLYSYADDMDFDAEYVVFDIETTGLNPSSCDITEIGAVRVVGGEIKDRFQTFVKPSAPIPPKIVSLTGITDEMVADAPLPAEALPAFYEFCGENAVLVAHNSDFDTKFVFGKSRPLGIEYKNKVVDSVPMCRVAFPELKNHKLNTVAKHLRIPLLHHRAVNDAECTARILLKCFDIFKEQGADSMDGVNSLAGDSHALKHERTSHVIILCKNKRGLRNLYKLISDSHINYFYRRPRMPKSLINELREGLIVGSACENSDIYSAIVAGASEAKLAELASFYDFLEIQPLGNNEFMVAKGILPSMDAVRACNKKMVELGEKLNKPVVATCDVHFLDPHGEYFRRIIFKTQGYDDASQPPLYLRTTEEMLDEFSYLGAEKAHEVVVENTNRIAEMTEEIQLFQDDTAMPVIEKAAEHITELAYKTAKEKYGDPLPEIVEARLKRELDSIVGHGFSVLYYSAHKLVKKSLDDGYLVGSRGSVGSSLAATMTGITEVNPLPPHYICPKCRHSDFEVDAQRFACGVDLPDADCPVCGARYNKDGYDIPFEVFLGINADKVPDIDLNFSGEYQGVAHKYTEELFGEGHVFRAGTISAVQDRIAYGYVKKYLEETGQTVNAAEMDRLIQGVSGVKKTTGQHPGGMVIVPHDREVYEFTPVQRPADKADAEFITTHFDFNSMHDILIKLDILGHDVPTIIRILQDMTGMDPLTIPLDDKPTMELFSSLKPLGITPEQLLGIKTGTLGIPEFGTKFVRQMLIDTMPATMSEIVRISGLSHGTDVWLGNAQDLIKSGVCTLNQAICTRDDIMNYLVSKGVEKRTAFFIMENVRKGKVAKTGFSEDDLKALSDAEIPQWFIDSCCKIKYMFPKAHAVAYVTMAFRIAYCKVHHKEAFYASYFTVRSAEFDASFAAGGLEDIKKNWQMLEQKGKAASANEQKMAGMLEVACEMYLRGVHFLPVDLQKSDAVRYIIEDGSLRLPFQSLPKLGENAARTLVAEREKAPFLSVEDLKKRTRISAAVIEEMHKMGTLAGLKETNQISLFDI